MGKVLYINFSEECQEEIILNNYEEIRTLRDIAITLYYRALNSGENKIEDNYIYIKNLNGIMESYLKNNMQLTYNLKQTTNKVNKILRYKVKNNYQARQYLIYTVDFFDSVDINYGQIRNKRKKGIDTLGFTSWLVAFFCIYIISEFTQGMVKNALVALDLCTLICGILYIAYKSSCNESKILSEHVLKKNIEIMKRKYCL